MVGVAKGDGDLPIQGSVGGSRLSNLNLRTAQAADLIPTSGHSAGVRPTRGASHIQWQPRVPAMPRQVSVRPGVHEAEGLA
jgi:hypothetical protein